MDSWWARFTAGISGAEHELVERYTARLVALAARRMPVRVWRRVDPDDIVQSVYRSFFRRLDGNQLCLEGSDDLWRLLVTITYYQIQNTVKYHQRQRRDIRREAPGHDSAVTSQGDVRRVGREDLEVFQQCLEDLLKGLPEGPRSIVRKRLEGETIDAIANQLQRSRRTVIRILANVRHLAARTLEAAR